MTQLGFMRWQSRTLIPTLHYVVMKNQPLISTLDGCRLKICGPCRPARFSFEGPQAILRAIGPEGPPYFNPVLVKLTDMSVMETFHENSILFC